MYSISMLAVVDFSEVANVGHWSVFQDIPSELVLAKPAKKSVTDHQLCLFVLLWKVRHLQLITAGEIHT